MTQTVAFLGLGTMGAPMAANLARRGFRVKGWNRTPGRPGLALAETAGVEIQATLANAVQDADLILTCVGNGADVEAVLLAPGAAADCARPQSLIIDFSTIGVEAAQSVGAALAAKGLRFLDGPVSGGDIGAQRGTLTIMVGGAPADFTEAEPYLQALGSQIIHCGPLGSGQAVKLCNQVLVSLNMIGLCEAATLARRLGIDPQLMIQVCQGGAAGSWALTHLGPKVVQGDYEPGFMIRHILKDLGFVQAAAPDLAGLALAQSLFAQVAQLPQGAEQGTQAMMRAYDNPRQSNA
ncbi:MAG: NAD(P)-dependent oxidoreductase [Cyanobacteriota bacterium]|jgi:3-hydroxyisobutyrate dehydrogenase